MCLGWRAEIQNTTVTPQTSVHLQYVGLVEKNTLVKSGEIQLITLDRISLKYQAEANCKFSAQRGYGSVQFPISVITDTVVKGLANQPDRKKKSNFADQFAIPCKLFQQMSSWDSKTV